MVNEMVILQTYCTEKSVLKDDCVSQSWKSEYSFLKVLSSEFNLTVAHTVMIKSVHPLDSMDVLCIILGHEIWI